MDHKPLIAALAALLALPGYSMAQQEVELAPGDSVTIRALADTVFVVDTLIQRDTVTVTQIDTVLVTDTVYACPPGWTCNEAEAPPAPEMYVAGWMSPGPPEPAEHNGLHIEWQQMPADSFRVRGGKQDGTDWWMKVVPGTDTIYRHELFYDTVTAMRGCVSAIRFGIEGPAACDDFDWPPMVQALPDELPGAPGSPSFTALEDGRVRVTWNPAEHATSYTYWYTGHAESEGLTTPTNSVVLDDFADGGFFCTRGVNHLGPAPGPTYRCNAYRP